jgi:hypothetical protein
MTFAAEQLLTEVGGIYFPLTPSSYAQAAYTHSPGGGSTSHATGLLDRVSDLQKGVGPDWVVGAVSIRPNTRAVTAALRDS